MEPTRINWEPRVRPHLIRQLYDADAAGLADEKLIDEVGLALLMRCETIRRVTERRCPHCGQRLSGAFDSGPRDRTIACPDCGWASTWDTYHRSYKNHRIHGGRAFESFLEFLRSYPKCRSAPEKMLAIDRLIHAVHETPGKGGNAAASNLIYEKKPGWAKRLLDDLAYGDQRGTDREGLREKYLEKIELGRATMSEHNRQLRQRWSDQRQPLE